MIKQLTSGSPHLTVHNVATNSEYVGNNGPGAGTVRYNTTTQRLEAFDGSLTWQNITETTSIGLTYDTEKAIRWAQDKMMEERALKERMERHPGLRDAYEKFQIMDILTKEKDDQSAER
jgi:hypothetical protein